MTSKDEQVKALKEAIQQVSPDFKELIGQDIEVSKIYQDPMLLAAYMYRLAEERRKYNEELTQLNAKVDYLVNEFRKSSETPSHPSREQSPSLSSPPLHPRHLPLQDQKILSFIDKKRAVTAEDVQKHMGYSGQNGASNRLNMLQKQGFLEKIRSGKKMIFTLIPQKSP